MSELYILEGELLEKIIPQKAPMLFCDKVEINKNNLNIGAGYFLIGNRVCVGLDEEQNLPIVSLIEVMAQSVVGVLGYSYYLKNQIAGLGLFLALRNFKVFKKFDKGVIPKGTLLRTDVEIYGDVFNDDIIQISMSAFMQTTNEIISSGKFTFFMPSKEQIQELFAGRMIL